MGQTTLYIFAGLPGSGKTTLSQAFAARICAAHLRIDTLEQALRDLYAVEVQGEGYRLGYRVAGDILRSGVSVAADSCNPIELTRREWEQVALDAGVTYVNVEVVCSDPTEHRRRIETRKPSVLGMRLPTWQDVLNREYDGWSVSRIVLDTANRNPEACVDSLMTDLAVLEAKRWSRRAHRPC